MKKFLVGIFLLLLTSPVLAGDTPIYVTNVFSNQAVAANSSVTSGEIDLSSLYTPDGYFGLQVTVAGSGTAKITYTLSNDHSMSYATHYNSSGTDQSVIVTALTAGSAFYSFSPALARYIKFTVEETGDSDPVTVTAVLSVQ